MEQIDNYTSSRSSWMWTGIRTLNQIWSYFRITEPIIVTSIEAYWGGYDRRTKGRHFIAEWTPGDGKQLGKILVKSNEISVPQGRGWRTATCKPTLLEPGSYAVGIWGDYLGRRTNGIWNGDGGGAVYVATTSSLKGNITGSAWSPSHGIGVGVIPMRINYEPAGRAWVKHSGSWRKGQVWVKHSGSWRKAKAVWVKHGGTWRRSI